MKRYSRLIFLIFLGIWLPMGALAAESAVSDNDSTKVQEKVVLPRSVPDPFEPANRALWAFNRGLMIRVVKPSAKVYRFIVRKPIRTGIHNFGRNITYPGRLINNLLEAKWIGARDESYRFGCNTVLGVGGLLTCLQMENSKIRCRFRSNLWSMGMEASFLSHAANLWPEQ